MKKLYSLIAVAFTSIGILAQAFTATYDFVESPTNTDNGTFTGSNFTTTVFSTTGATYNSSTGNRYANNNAPTGSLDVANYIEVTITPDATYKMSISSITMKLQRSGTGPRDFAVRSSVDNYATNLPATIDPTNTELSVIATNVLHYVNDISTGQSGSTITPTTIVDIATPITIRIYPFTSEASTGTFSVDDFVISGTITTTNLAVNNIKSFKNTFVKNTFVQDEIQFETKAEVKIYSMKGKMVKSAIVSENNNLEVADLASGIYIVTGAVNGEAVFTKIVKK